MPLTHISHFVGVSHDKGEIRKIAVKENKLCRCIAQIESFFETVNPKIVTVERWFNLVSPLSTAYLLNQSIANMAKAPELK